MATIPDNILQAVQTYVDPELGYLQNLNCFVHELNTKYDKFDEIKNLGDTVLLELPNRSTISSGLVANFQGVEQLKQVFTCDQAANCADAFTTQQFIFGADQYMDKFGMSRMIELSGQIEANVGQNATSSVPVMVVNNNGESVPTGELHTESGPFRFYGNGITPINSFNQLADIEAKFRNYGAATGPLKTFLPDMAVPSIISSGFNQFTLDRNNELSNSWDLGTYKGSNSRYFKSNLLPIHYAGTCGENQDVLTLVSTNDPTGQNITELTFSGVSVDAEAFKVNDLLGFDVNSNGGLVYLTYTVHKPSQNAVQVRVTESTDASGGTVTVKITPPLQSTPGKNQNLNKNLVAGMTAMAVSSHRAGLVVGGDAFYLAMPPLPSTTPFPSATQTDAETGVSLRSYYGTQFGRNQMGYVTDCIWASVAVPQYTLRICFPPN